MKRYFPFQALSSALFSFGLVLFSSLSSFAQPSNDACASAISITQGASCTNTSGTLISATYAAITGPCGQGTGNKPDVWYSFVAATSNVSVTLSSTTFNKPGLQLYSDCPAVTSIICGYSNGTSTSINATSLTVGATYYIRVYDHNGSTGTFNICVTTVALAGDECATATSLVSNGGCINTSATLIGATASGGIPTGCASAGTHYDVWFSFVAVQSSELITFKKNNPSNISNPELQLFSGGCGTLTSLQCGTTSIAATGLTPSATYYVRVSQVGGSALATRGGFDICVTHSATPPATIDYSKSYVNISKGTGGGTVNPGDTLEIRATFVVRSGTGTADSLAFFDTLYAAEGLALVPGSLALRTNEGKLYKSFTDNYDTDAGWKLESANNTLDTVIQINFGANASNVRRGSLTNTSRPSVFGSTCIIMATYRVVVTASYNNLINMGGGSLTLLNGGNYSDLKFNSTNVMVYSSPGLCPNAVSPTNALGAESNGTFGTPSGSAPLARNRGTSPYTTYLYRPFTATGGPNDYYYAVANNTSQIYTTLNDWAKSDGTNHRLFGHWDITGDHTNASNSLVGNLACDTTQPVSPSNPCGYMLVVNSAYKADTAFTYTVANLCPNTYYEISAWFKNICYKCGCDSTGTASGNAGYIPTATGDSSGVRPNIAFDVNGSDYYTTGDLLYLGLSGGQTGSDAANRWIKKGFTYLTGAAETSFTLTLRNNAPGGGGNDWALDDIAVATCLPSMSYSPSLAPNVCEGNALAIHDTIRSYLDNYIHYIWQKSVNNGSSWSDVTAPASVTLGAPVNGQYEFVTSYTIPPASTTVADSGTLYRVLVATAASNLGTSSCQVTDGISIINLAVNDCTPILATELLSFNGKLLDNKASLAWSTSKEDAPLIFIIEKSSDGTNFVTAGELSAYYNNNETNRYIFLDPIAAGDKTWYRIVMITPAGKKKYSSVIQLRNTIPDFAITNVINPFSGNLKFDIMTANNSSIIIDLIDISGKTVMTSKQQVYAGINSMNLTNTQSLASGIYTLRIANKDMFITKRVVKRN
ncbi:T9SS type A sorting domain-containing protein [Terrimonas pollutisoli]|uniref:T9SS type A sorting domain-containing protein n=1 Tax=Terrimonas pollutisoli TaxID=3034147 RepID=UPI0023EB647B|nr:T9SS type A sorting domain-containing protein [Terrimonas sp. H1YJ31]